jgi:hypothetical protein
VYAQNNVFVLVDVSKSVSQTDLNNAKQALTEVFTGSNLSMAQIHNKGALSDLAKFKFNVGDKLSVSRFGSCQTTWAITPSLNSINNLNSDITSTLNSISWSPTDNNTFILLAKAKIADYAVRNKIANYKLIIITDNIQTDFAKGKLNYCNNDAKDLAESYKSGNNPVIEGVYTLLKFNPSADFTIHLIQSVDVSNYNPGGGGIITPPLPLNSQAEIKLTSPPSKAKKGKEYEVKTETVNINWNCLTCPQGTKYTVLVSQYEEGKFRETKKELVANTATFKLPDGKFRITVSTSNTNASSDYTCISVSTGGYGWLTFLLLLIVGIGIGYYFWNKKRQEKIDVFASNKADDIFSKSSGGTTSSNSSNSDYF